MRVLLILALLLAAPAWAQFDPKTGRSTSVGYKEATYSTTPVFDASTSGIFRITLTGNVTSSTLSGETIGQFLRFIICQDATGSRTFTWPPEFVDAPTIQSNANECEIYIFIAEESGAVRYGGGSYSTGGGGAVSSVFGRTGAVVKQANDYLWNDVGSKPATFPPDTHGHAVADTTGLQTALDGKAASSHGHVISDTTGLQTALDGKEPANANIQAHIASTLNPHGVTKAQVGLGSVDNTSDLGKPVSTATQSLLDGKAALSHGHAQVDVTNLTTDLAAKQPLDADLTAFASLACTDGQIPKKAAGVWGCGADQTGAGGIPAGAAVLILTGSCSTTLGAGWTEAALGGKFLLLTVAASADIGTTGGQDTVTTVLNHTHPVTDPGHAHGLQRYPTTTGGSSGFTADTSMSGTPTAVTLPMVSTTTGVTTTNPAGGVASIDNRPSFVRVILCVKD